MSETELREALRALPGHAHARGHRREYSDWGHDEVVQFLQEFVDTTLDVAKPGQADEIAGLRIPESDPDHVTAYGHGWNDALRAASETLARMWSLAHDRGAGLDAERIARAYQRYQYVTGPRRSMEEYRLIAAGIVAADTDIRAEEAAK